MPNATQRHVDFPPTSWSSIKRLCEAQEPEERAALLSSLCGLYWAPLYGFARRRGYSPHDAEDLTQSFFEQLIEGNVFALATPKLGKLRTFLRASFLNHMRDGHKHRKAQKRGGQVEHLSRDAMSLEEQYMNDPQVTALPDDLYDRAWAIAFFGQVTERLREHYQTKGKSEQFLVLIPHLFTQREVSQEESAEALGVSLNTFRVMLMRFRKQYRNLFRQMVEETLDNPSESEVEDEIRELIRLASR